MHQSNGFTLIEVVVVLTVMALLMTMGLRMTTQVVLAQHRYATRDHMATIDTAIVSYVSQVRRLPCPADGALPGTDIAAGVEQRNASGDCLNNQARGVVPWRTLGLSEENATDGFFTRLTYRVAPGLTRDDAMNLANCDAAGSGTASGTAPNLSCRNTCVMSDMTQCTRPQNVLFNRGFEVRNAATGGVALADPAADPATGAAYLLVSHGENRGGGYSGDGTTQDAIATVGSGEGKNAGTEALQPFYVDSGHDGTDTATHFDDFISRPTILTLAIKANIGPRAYH